MEAGRMDPSGLGITKAGYWIGVISLMLNMIVIAGYVLMFVIAVLNEMQ